MGFLFHMIIWVFSLSVITYLGYRYYLKPRFNKKRKKVNHKITNYGGPELELPPGIVLENDDENKLSRKEKA